ncbi:LOW QUALITY PROTEIN: coiled-coil domain-containing protein 66 [Embiotoca jacksoni]|uniref:LOW QUALITY PROTEIN: coiled-coil domain-containing protein 66 n=1 Tax=Embiotoca jacksoni TaxID=100190 RepID=UPI0037042EEB
MNLGDGLLFELQNGKPRLIFLHGGVEKNPSKQQQPSFRPRAANVLSSRQPSCVEEARRREEEEKEERSTRQPTGRRRDAGTKVGGAAASFASNASAAAGRSGSTTGTSSKTHDHQRGGGAKAVAKKVKSDRHKRGPVAGPPSTNGKTGPPQNTGSRASGKAGLTDVLANGNAALRDGVVRLTGEQLQQILNTVQTSSNGQNTAEEERTPGNKTASKCVNERGEMEEEDRGGGGGGGEEEEEEEGGGGNDSTGSSQEKDNRSSGCLFSWLEERQSDSRAAVDAKKAQWKRELDEQVALKQQQQQRSAPSRLQAEEDSESVLSMHREPPAAMRSSLRLGEVTPMEEVLSVERKEEQKRRWLEELDRQREETVERRRREKLVHRQTEDQELWAAHFDSLQRRPLLLQPVAPPPAQFSGSERGDWEPSSSLSLVWEAASSCGAESVAGASVDTSRTSYLRTMTSLLDPAQIEERERRRLKQLEQQRAIEAQVEERRRQREQDETKRRQEEEEEDQRVALERETLQRLYEQDTLKERQKEQQVHQAEQPNKDHDDGRLQETLESNVTRQNEGLEDVSTFKHIAVQTEAAPSLPLVADRVQTPDVSAQYQPPPPAPPAPPAPPPNIRSRASRTGKENMCVAAGGDPYEAFVRTERSRRDKRRPEWNTQRPSRRFVPASQRYPASLQRNRQESRLKRQAELLALQERTCLSRTDPPPPPLPPPQHQEPRLGSDPTQTGTSPTRRGETGSGGNGSSAGVEGGRSPLVPVVRHRVQTSSTPPVLEFVPYVRTDDVFNLEPSDAPSVPPQSSTSPPAAAHRDPLLHPELLRNTHTHRQQEILRGLAQLRQGLLQKQRELETDLNPLLKLHDNGHRSPSTTHRM